MSDTAGKVPICLKWRLLSPTGPEVAHHAACIHGNSLYVHGGIDKARSTQPLSKFHFLDLDSGLWQEVRAPGSPALSHHASLVLQGRYFVLIGGWDGSKRTCNVHVFDLAEPEWFECETEGFPSGAGLSSHTANEVGDGIVVIGREGSARMQRKFGNAFLIKGNIKSRRLRYSEFPLSVDSRSGHTTHIMNGRLVIFGGRGDQHYEQHQIVQPREPPPGLMTRLPGLISRMKPVAGREPCGRKHHVSVGGNDLLLIHGGETFDGRSRDPVADVYVLTTRPSWRWYKLDSAPIGRAGHSLCVRQGNVVVHGGVGAGGVVYADTYEVSLEGP